MRDAMALAKLRKMHCLFLYVCVQAGRKDMPDQNAGGKIVFSVSFGCSSNPKEGIGCQSSSLAQCLGLLALQNSGVVSL